MEYGRTTAVKPTSVTARSNAAAQLTTCGIDFGIAVKHRFALLIPGIIATALGQLRQLAAQRSTFLLLLAVTLGCLIGGLHLLNAPRERIEQTSDFLVASSLQTIIPLHCTGENAVAALRERLGAMIHLTGHFSLEPAALR